MDFAKLGIKRLSYDNYETWTIRARQVLTREGLWSYVCAETPDEERTTQWQIKDELALQTIGFLIEDAQLRIIKDAGTAREAWVLLKEYYVKDSSVGIVALIKKLSKLELAEGGDMRQHLVEFEDLFERIENVGCRMDDDMKVAFILASLPQSYESIVASIQDRMDVFTMIFVKTKLLEEFERRRERGDEFIDRKALAVEVFQKQARSSEEQRLCYACGSANHVMRNCELLKKVRNESSRVPVEPKMRSAVAIEEEVFHGSVCFKEETHGGWYLDSGASSHMTGRADLLNGTTRMEKQNVILANGKNVLCDTKGKITVHADNGKGCSVTVAPQDVIVVPGLPVNLVSVPAITKRGLTVVFSANECHIMKGDSIIVVGRKEGNHYRLNV